VLSRLGNIYAFILGWPFLKRFNYSLFYLSARAIGLLNYSSAKISGENRAISLAVSGKSAPVVFDVGANEGQWIAEVLAVCPNAIIHAFEPQIKLAALVGAKYPNVVVNNLGVGDAVGVLELFDYAGHAGSQHASLMAGVIDGIHNGNLRSQSVSVETLDAYCAQHHIEHIDFLKIDVEGFELKVLHGANLMLKSNKIDVIQFEFNEMNVIGRTFMRDFFECLGDNFKIYRLLPHGLMLLDKKEHWFNEQFLYQNVLAINNK
jgi:FkbM family methyltransferase